MSDPLKRMLLVADTPHDAETTLAEHHLVNEVVRPREPTDPIAAHALGVKPAGLRRFVEAIRRLGAFCSLHAAPPPTSAYRAP